MNELSAIKSREIRDVYKESLRRPHGGRKSSSLKIKASENEIFKAGNILSFLREQSLENNNFQLALEIGGIITALGKQALRMGILPNFNPLKGREQASERLNSKFRGIVTAIENKLKSHEGIL